MYKADFGAGAIAAYHGHSEGPHTQETYGRLGTAAIRCATVHLGDWRS